MIVKFKKLSPDAVTPTYAHPDDAGLDLTATNVRYDIETNQLVCGTSLAVEIPTGFVGLITPRSSISNTGLALSNSVGVIDSGYTGEIIFKFNSVFGTNKRGYKKGDRIGQLLILPIGRVTMSETDELKQSSRGTGGYGSTGV